MKKILLLSIFSAICIFSFSQSTVLLRGDTIKVYKQGGSATLRVDSILMLTKMRAGASTDSILTWDAASKTVKMRNASGFSGTIGGSILDNQVAVGSALNTIEGTNSLTFDGSTFNVGNNPAALYTGTGSDITSTGYASGSWWISSIRNSQAYSITPSAGLLSSVKYNSAGDYTALGGIAWQKENAVDGENGSRAFLYTRANGGSLTSALEINADQEMLFGGADAGDIKFQVFPKTASEFGLLIRLQAAATADAWQVQNSAFGVLGFLDANGLLYGVTGAYGTSTTPSTKAVLDLGSTTKGFLPPRMSDAQRTAITSVPASLFVWDTDSARYMGYDGANWRGIPWTGEAGGGGGSGTVNTGAAKKAAYYPSAGTTVDDVTGVEYNNTNLLAKLSTQATTDVGLEIKLQSSQTANALDISSSAGTADLAIITAAGASRFTSLKVGTASNTFAQLYANGEALFSSDGGAILNDPLGFDNTHQIYGSGNARFNVGAGSFVYRTSVITGAGLNSYYGGLDGGFVGQETNQALNLITNDVTRLTITSAGAITVPEQAASATPAANNVTIYPKSDGLWYGKDDAGVETKLSNDAGGTPTWQQVLTAGSTLTTNNTISTSTNITTFSTGNTNGSLYSVNIDNSGAGGSLGVTGNSGTTVVSFTNSNIGDALALNTGSGAGMRTSSTGGLGASFVVNPSSTNTSVSLFEAQRLSSGTAANRMAGSFDLKLESASGNSRNSNKIITMWADATDATRSTIFGILGTSQAITDTLTTMGDYVTLTESSATQFTTTTIATGKIQGGTILITVEGNDATDFQSRTLRFIWSAVNKAGTLTITISTPEEVVALSSGTLTCTITAVDAGSGVLSFRANAVSSLTQSTLRATYQTFKNF